LTICLSSCGSSLVGLVLQGTRSPLDKFEQIFRFVPVCSASLRPGAIRNDASRHAVLRLRAPFGTKGSVVQIHSPRPPIEQGTLSVVEGAPRPSPSALPENPGRLSPRFHPIWTGSLKFLARAVSPQSARRSRQSGRVAAGGTAPPAVGLMLPGEWSDRSRRRRARPGRRRAARLSVRARAVARTRGLQHRGSRGGLSGAHAGRARRPSLTTVT
jgi:hypothetical protein